MRTAAVGFRVHSGWTSLVVVALEKGKPIVLARQRPHLVQTFSYTFRQPYHTAEKMTLDEASAFLERQRAEARRLAVAALKAAETDIEQQGYKVTRAALLTASGRPLPELAKILTAHALIQAGMVYLITGSVWFFVAELTIHWITDFGKCEKWFDINTDQGIHVACKIAWAIL